MFWLQSNSGKWIMTGLVLLLIAVVALSFDWLREQVKRWSVLLLGALVLLLAALWIHGARAHDHNNTALDDWYATLASAKGSCCGGPKVDATILADVDWESKGGHYRVRIEGQWHDVPDDAVLSVPNLDGRTLVWPIKGWGGLTIRCFMPGVMG